MGKQDEFATRGIAPPFYALIGLPSGAGRGFVTITLAYLLSQNGVSVAAIAGLVALYLTPDSWKVVTGPVLDMGLSPPRWLLVLGAAAALVMASFAFIPLDARTMPLIGTLGFALAATLTAATVATQACIANTAPQAERGRVAGWWQCGNLGGAGLGGGLGLWLAKHVGGAATGQATAALVLATLFLACLVPVLWLRAPRPAGRQGVGAYGRGLWRAVWAMARTRSGALAILAVSLPASLGAASGLLAAVAGDWRASADLVAVVLGALGGLANLPGCVVGGYLCDRFPRRSVYVVSALGCALAEAAMAWGPHTPAAFVVFVLLNGMLLGVAWAAVSAVIYEQLGAQGAATVGALLSSLANIPVAVVTVIVGAAQVRHGSGAMLLAEAGIAVAALAVYVAVATLWRPAVVRAAEALA